MFIGYADDSFRNLNKYLKIFIAHNKRGRSRLSLGLLTLSSEKIQLKKRKLISKNKLGTSFEIISVTYLHND